MSEFTHRFCKVITRALPQTKASAAVVGDAFILRTETHLYRVEEQR